MGTDGVYRKVPGYSGCTGWWVGILRLIKDHGVYGYFNDGVGLLIWAICSYDITINTYYIPAAASLRPPYFSTCHRAVPTHVAFTLLCYCRIHTTMPLPHSHYYATAAFTLLPYCRIHTTMLLPHSHYYASAVFTLLRYCHIHTTTLLPHSHYYTTEDRGISLLL